MKSFCRILYRTLWKNIAWMLAIQIIVLAMVNWFTHWYGAPPLYEVNAIIFGFILIGYGISRAWRFHPVFNKTYLTQLSLSPWNREKALPRGPVHLFWADIVILAVFTALTFVFPVTHWTLPFIFFLAAYNAGLLISFFITGLSGLGILYIFLAPLTVYPFFNFHAALIVLIGLTGIGTFGIHSYFAKFPWNTPWWNEDLLAVLKQRAKERRIILWPFRELSADSVFSSGLEVGLLMSILFFVYAHVINWIAYKTDNDRLTPLFYIVPLFLAPFFRSFAYIAQHHPPISFFGRICTGRLIIPKYDVVFLAPIATLLAGVFAPYLLKMIAVPNYIAYELAGSLSIFMALAFPPTFEKWHFTGQHRIVRSKTTANRTGNKKYPVFLSRLNSSAFKN